MLDDRGQISINGQRESVQRKSHDATGIAGGIENQRRVGVIEHVGGQRIGVEEEIAGPSSAMLSDPSFKGKGRGEVLRKGLPFLDFIVERDRALVHEMVEAGWGGGS